MTFHSDLSVLVLGVLETSGSAHGYEIARRITAAADSVGGHIRPRAAQLYPVLHRMENDGKITARWASQGQARDGSPPRRVYKITARGRRALEDNRADWERFTASVCLLIGVKQTPPKATNG